MHPENLKSVFLEYLQLKNNQYSILLNGTWGSGKTFFWNNTLSAIVKESGCKPIYVSLNGIASIDELRQQLFIKLLPFINPENETFSKITQVFGNLVNKASKAFLKTDFSDLFNELSLDVVKFDKIVICFDDWERTLIPYKQLFGFINDFVEHRHLKCVILSDEVKINPLEDEKKVPEYHAIKEKVIGRILNYEPDLSSVLQTFFNRFKSDQKYFSFLDIHKDYLLTLFKEIKANNLRVISFIFENLHKIIKNIPEIEESYQQEIILFTVIISTEFKKGFLQSNKYKDYDILKQIPTYSYSIYDSLIKGTSLSQENQMEEKKSPTKDESYFRKIYDLYLKNRPQEYHFYPSIYSFILSGYFDSKLFQNDIDKHIPTNSTPDRELKMLSSYDFRELDNNTFSNLIENVLKSAEKGVYSIYQYQRVANAYFFFIEKGLIYLNTEQLNKKLIKGIDIAAKRKEIDINECDRIRNFHDPNKSRINHIMNKIFDVHEEIKSSLQAKESNSIISLMESEYISDIKELFWKNERNVDFLCQINVEKLFNKLKTSNNKILHLFNTLLRERYQNAHHYNSLIINENIEFISQLEKQVKLYLEENNFSTDYIKKLNFCEMQENLSNWKNSVSAKST